VSLGVVFIWFGALKVTNSTPVADLVAGTVPWVDPTWFVPFLGTVEVVVGVLLIAGRRLTAVSCGQAQAVEACASTSSVNSSEGFFQL